jgi:hypothetical protein
MIAHFGIEEFTGGALQIVVLPLVPRAVSVQVTFKYTMTTLLEFVEPPKAKFCPDGKLYVGKEYLE